MCLLSVHRTFSFLFCYAEIVCPEHRQEGEGAAGAEREVGALVGAAGVDSSVMKAPPQRSLRQGR